YYVYQNPRRKQETQNKAYMQAEGDHNAFKTPRPSSCHPPPERLPPISAPLPYLSGLFRGEPSLSPPGDALPRHSLGSLNASNDFRRKKNMICSELGPGHVEFYYIPLKLAMLNPTTMFNYDTFIVPMPPSLCLHC